MDRVDKLFRILEENEDALNDGAPLDLDDLEAFSIEPGTELHNLHQISLMIEQQMGAEVAEDFRRYQLGEVISNQAKGLLIEFFTTRNDLVSIHTLELLQR